jgi:hypothetical protein
VASWYIFCRHLIIFVAILVYFLPPFDNFCRHFGIFYLWRSFFGTFSPHFGLLRQEISGNPGPKRGKKAAIQPMRYANDHKYVDNTF